MPVPVDTVHAAQIASFFNQQDELSVPAPEEVEEAPPPEPRYEAAKSKFSYADLLSDD